MMNLIYFIIYSIVFLFGIVIGSFLNVVIYRVPNNISVAKGRSYCPLCNTYIKDYDLIPVLSYFILGGKCRACKGKISPRYALVEFFTGILAIFIVYFNGFDINSILIFIFVATLLCIAMVDYDTMTIPNSLIISLIPVAVAFVFLGPQISILSRIIGFFAVSLPMYASLYLIEDGFGGADIKLFAVIGFILGWKNVLLTLFIAIVLAALFGVTLLIIKNENYKGKHIPFGPFICTGALISILFGNDIIKWYLSFFGLL